MEKNRKRILIVDHKANLRKVFSDVLRRKGYLIKAVKDASAALKAIDKETFDVALVDLGISKMDGIEILDNIKKRKPQIPVIIYTGHGSVTTAVAAMRRGAADYLNRPFSPEELMLAIKKALEHKGNISQPS
ncbi:response regulator [bacterium]|nr:response regulator [bacterium]